MTTTDRAARYLDDLARLLTGMDPPERAEVLDSVREHIDSAVAELGREPTLDDLDRILGELGAPGAVAAEALAGRGERAVPVVVPLRDPRPALARGWVPPTAVLLIIVGALFGIFVLPLAALVGGVVLLCASPLWTTVEKVIGALLAPLGLLPVIVASLVTYRVSGDPGGAATPIWPVLIPAAALTALVVLVLLWVRGARRAAAWPGGAPAALPGSAGS